MIPKFRAWDKETKTMYDVKSIVYTLGSMLCVNRSALFPERTLYFEDTPVMQSTGLADENGKEIFEGDVVHAYGEDTYLIGVIEYFDNAYCIKNKTGIYNPLWINAEQYEIIGNIYENPEVVEGLNERV